MLKVGSKWISKQIPRSINYDFSSTSAPSHESPRISLYDKTNIDDLQWPDNEDGQYAKKFLLPLIKEGCLKYFDNISTDIKILKIENLILPITINNAEYDNSYVCSPFSYFIKSAVLYADIIKNPLLHKIVKGLFWGLSKLFKALKFNKVVIINNWLISTNLIPRMDPEYFTLITQFLQNQFPAHALIFRSVNPRTNEAYYEALKNSNYRMIAARQIFFTDTQKEHIFESRLFKSDLKLLQSSEYEIIDSGQLTKDEAARMLELYREIYICKYSLHPQLNLNYVQWALNAQILKFKAIKKDGMIDGIAGYVCRNGIMTCPFFGYDKTKPQQDGLYRILSTILMLEAKQNHWLFHQSAGASTYKKIRKATDCIEYTAVYDKHLSLTRKLPWFFIKAIFNSVGIFYMKKY